MLSVNVLLSVSCESMCICRQELLFLALARHFHLIEVQGSEGLGEDPPHSLSSPRLQHKFIVEMRMHMLIPKSIQTLFGNGDSPYGNIRLSLPISVRGLPIWKWGVYFPPKFGQEIVIFPLSRITLKALIVITIWKQGFAHPLEITISIW